MPFLLGGASFGASSQQTSNQFNQNQNQNFNTSTARTLTPYQTSLQPSLFSLVNSAMTNPQSYLAPFKQQARDATSSTYSGLADTLRQQFLGTTGGGQSGKFGTALAQGNLQRLGALQGVDTSFAEQASQLPFSAAQIAQSLLGMNFGSTSSGSSTGTTSGTSSGTSSGTNFGLNFGGQGPI